MLVSGYNNIILLPNCTMLYYVFSGPLSLRAYVPEIKFNKSMLRAWAVFQLFVLGYGLDLRCWVAIAIMVSLTDHNLNHNSRTIVLP